MAKRQLDVEIRARNLVKSGLAGAHADVDRFASGVKKSGGEMAGFASSATEKLNATLRVMGHVELATKAVTAVTGVFSGDLEAADQALKSMPMGIGPVYTAFSELLAVVTGVKERMAEFAEQAKANQDAWLRSVAVAKQVAQLLAGTETLRRGTGLIGLEGVDAEIAGIKERWVAGLAGIKRMLAEAREKYGGEDNAAFRTVEMDIRERRKALDERMLAETANAKRKASEAEIAEANKVQEKIAKQNEQNWERTVALATQRGRDTRSLEAELAARRLQAAGKDDEAQLVRIRASYAARIELAKDAHQRQMLEELRDIELAGIGGQGQQQAARGVARGAARGVAGASLSQQFRGLSEIFTARGQRTPEEDTAQNTKETAVAVKKTTQAVDNLTAAMLAAAQNPLGTPLNAAG